jgi:3-hydroxyisobutyrate dehydrogenase-like beta-hydroxyacid dehydrogenase
MGEVAVLGVGRMGSAMAARLVAARHEVRVWNRTEGPARAFADSHEGVRACPTPGEAVEGAEVVLSVLADGEATRTVLLDTGTLRCLSERTIVVDLATSGVDTALRVGAGLAAAGRRFVDAPVSGSVPSVQAGSLLVMAAGADDDIAAALPVLSAFARKVIRVGDVGAGQTMKLAVNLVVHDLNAALSEALMLAESASIARESAYDVFLESVVAAPFVQYKRSAFVDAETPVAMSLALVEKDLRLISELARSAGIPVPVTEEVLTCVKAAVSEGWGERDMADLSRRISPPQA